jgi:hypothetical protein
MSRCSRDQKTAKAPGLCSLANLRTLRRISGISGKIRRSYSPAFSALNPMPTVDSAAAARGQWRGQAALRREAGAQATRRAGGDHCVAPVYGSRIMTRTVLARRGTPRQRAWATHAARHHRGSSRGIPHSKVTRRQGFPQGSSHGGCSDSPGKE